MPASSVVEPDAQKVKVPLTDGVGFAFTVVVMLAEAVVAVKQVAFDVNVQTSTSLLFNDASVYVLLLFPTVVPFFVHA